MLQLPPQVAVPVLPAKSTAVKVYTGVLSLLGVVIEVAVEIPGILLLYVKVSPVIVPNANACPVSSDNSNSNPLLLSPSSPRIVRLAVPLVNPAVVFTCIVAI